MPENVNSIPINSLNSYFVKCVQEEEIKPISLPLNISRYIIKDTCVPIFTVIKD